MADQHDLARDLLGLAQDDLVAAEALLDVAAVSDAIVGFHAQQAVEKAFKAVLADHGASFPFTHNVGLLMTLCADTGALAPSSLADADLLTPYGVAPRYDAKTPGTVDRVRRSAWQHGGGLGSRAPQRPTRAPSARLTKSPVTARVVETRFPPLRRCPPRRGQEARQPVLSAAVTRAASPVRGAWCR